MANNIVKYQASDGVEVSITPADVAAITTGNAQLTPAEAVQIMAKAQSRGLNILAGDAYVMKYEGKNGASVNLIVSKDYFMRTATQQPTFQGLKAGVVVAKKDTGELVYREGTIVGGNTEALVGGWAEVYDARLATPMRAEVAFKEYNTGKNLWLSKPATMIRKVALVQALREAYPGAYGGLYDADEMPAAPTAPVQPQTPAETPTTPQPQEVAAEVVPAGVDPNTGEVLEADLYDTDVEF